MPNTSKLRATRILRLVPHGKCDTVRRWHSVKLKCFNVDAAQTCPEKYARQDRSAPYLRTAAYNELARAKNSKCELSLIEKRFIKVKKTQFRLSAVKLVFIHGLETVPLNPFLNWTQNMFSSV